MAHTVGLGYTHVGNDEPSTGYNEKALTDVSYARPSDAERDVGLYNQPGAAPVVRERYEPRMESVQAAGTAFPLAPQAVAAEAPSRTMQLAYSDPCKSYIDEKGKS